MDVLVNGKRVSIGNSTLRGLHEWLEFMADLQSERNYGPLRDIVAALMVTDDDETNIHHSGKIRL